MAELPVEIKKRLYLGKALHAIKDELINEGFTEEDVDLAINQVSVEERSSQHIIESRNYKLVALKEVSDRIGYGITNNQFLNILLISIGGSYFLVGLLNGIRSLLSMLISTFIHEFSRVGHLKKTTIMWSGIVFAISFMLMAVGIWLRKHLTAYSDLAIPLYSLGFVISAIFVVVYGDTYYNLVSEKYKKERLGHFLLKISHYGLVITGISILIGGVLLDKIPGNGAIYILLGSCILYLLSLVYVYFTRITPDATHADRSMSTHLVIWLENTKNNALALVKDKAVLILLLTGAATSIVQVLGNAYYGFFIYRKLFYDGLGGYLNVALIFFVALLASFFGSMFSQKNAVEYGKFPMLVFGTLLMAIMPLTYYFNPSLLTIGMATVLGILGSSIVGVARGLLAYDLISDDMRKRYFSTSNILFSIPYLIFIPLGAYIARNDSGMRDLFLLLGLSLIIFVFPLYFVIIIMNHYQKKVQ